MINCNSCGVELDETNWSTSWKSVGRQQCTSCSKGYNTKSNEDRLFINGKYIKKDDPLRNVFKPGKYKSISDATFKTSAASSIVHGYVYVITNKAWDGWVKIGMAIDAEDRLSGYQTSSPHRDYVLEHKVYSADRRVAEQEAHTKAILKSVDRNGEWFKLSVAEAINILDNLNERDGTPEETNKDTAKDKLQERPVQADFGF